MWEKPSLPRRPPSAITRLRWRRGLRQEGQAAEAGAIWAKLAFSFNGGTSRPTVLGPM